MTTRRTGGFTLLELMVVLAIVAVLAGLAAVMLDPRPRSDDASQTTAALVREASRKAVERGSLRAEVAAALGTTARTRVLVSQDDGQITLRVEVLVEAEAPSTDATWMPLSTRTVRRGVSIDGWTARAVLDDGQTAEETLDDGETIEILCYPEGLCDGSTIYFRGRGSNRARIAVLPLGGAPMTFKSW